MASGPKANQELQWRARGLEMSFGPARDGLREFVLHLRVGPARAPEDVEAVVGTSDHVERGALAQSPADRLQQIKIRKPVPIALDEQHRQTDRIEMRSALD